MTGTLQYVALPHGLTEVPENSFFKRSKTFIHCKRMSQFGCVLQKCNPDYVDMLCEAIQSGKFTPHEILNSYIA
jgi:hypothetical protein